MKLQQVREFALSLPEATEELHFEYTSFRVKGKIFATAPPNEEHLHVFVEEEHRAPLIAADPNVFEALRWGSKVVGLRVTLAHASSGTVIRLLLESWARKAPRRLAVALRQGAGQQS
ncbi:MmcQ/YjbR family DNA-binding protein [Polaromonas sp.]|uniref:MmcQ/YjbR family DNA-binding protein n=1 Tax=Polaromonas sp. TaxID=1869339 RepID=UPI003CC536CE